MASSMFLSLPCEQRDIIYSHLSQRIRYKWPWPHWTSARPYLLELRDVTLENAPLTDNLLVNSQIHCEYQEILKSRPFSATITIKLLHKKHAFDRNIDDKDCSIHAISHLR